MRCSLGTRGAMQACTAASEAERMTGFISVCRASRLPGNILAG